MDESELVAAAKRPTAEWMAECFGADGVWRPTEEELPERLEDAGARAFLTEVGVPAVRLDFADWDSTGLLTEGLWAEDPAELFGERYPDDPTPPASYAYSLGIHDMRHLMLRGDSGLVDVYDPDGWDHAAGYGGRAASSLPQLVGALCLLARFEERLTGPQAAAALEELTALLEQLEQGPDDSTFWGQVLTALEEEYAVDLEG